MTVRQQDQTTGTPDDSTTDQPNVGVFVYVSSGVAAAVVGLLAFVWRRRRSAQAPDEPLDHQNKRD